MPETSTSDPGEPIHGSLFYFGRGFLSAFGSILTYTLFATYIGIGALAHDLGFSPLWAFLGTVLVWAAPAQMILLTTFGGGGTMAQTAVAVTLSAVRLLPMVASLLPLIRGPRTPSWQLILPSHFIAITVWVESFRLLPNVPRARRVAFINGLGSGIMGSTAIATLVGYNLAATLPPLFGSAVLFLTPITFLLSTTSNSRYFADRAALALGLIMLPAVAFFQTGLDMLISGVGAGTIAYAADRVRRRR